MKFSSLVGRFSSSRRIHHKNNNLYCFGDFRKAAHRKLPKFVFDFIDGGSGTEKALANNTFSFEKIHLTPRLADDHIDIDLSTDVLGSLYGLPFGIAPLGLPGLVHPNAEIIFSKIASKYKVPYIYSSASNTQIDKVSQASGESPWFQLYIPKHDALLDGLLELAERNKCPVLVVTVDTAAPGRRIRDLRNGLEFPIKLKVKNFFDMAKCPDWLVRRLHSGKIDFPCMHNILKNSKSISFNEIMAMQTGGQVNWDKIRYIRSSWKGKIVLKGILSAQDAVQARTIGVDAVIVSNHGGRQLNSAPAPISLLEQFLSAGISRQSIMVDSGIRQGEDIIASIVSGAGFTFLGRLFVYALAAKGEAGVDFAFQMLINELHIAMSLMGVSSPSRLNQTFLYSGI